MNLCERVPLAPLTTFRVGGAARFFVEVRTDEEVKEAIAYAHERALPLFVLGGGSNIVVADDGFDGLVLAMRLQDVSFENRGEGGVRAVAGAGVVWDDLVAQTVERGYGGLECLSGIPGTVGGAAVSNIGAYGAQCSDTFVRADVIDFRQDQVARTMGKEACDFSYHSSVFGREPGRYLIRRVTFALAIGETPRFSYRDNRFDVAALVSKNGREPTPADIRAAILAIRGEKGALDSSYKSAGSFFRMPYVSAEAYARIASCAHFCDATKEEALRPWAWEQLDGSYKLAPGFLLEYTEFQKGYVRGAVGISPKHTLSIINRGGARARDIAQLARDMQEAVQTKFDVRLEREVEYVGDVERDG